MYTAAIQDIEPGYISQNGAEILASVKSWGECHPHPSWFVDRAGDRLTLLWKGFPQPSPSLPCYAANREINSLAAEKVRTFSCSKHICKHVPSSVQLNNLLELPGRIAILNFQFAGGIIDLKVILFVKYHNMVKATFYRAANPLVCGTKEIGLHGCLSRSTVF